MIEFHGYQGEVLELALRAVDRKTGAQLLGLKPTSSFVRAEKPSGAVIVVDAPPEGSGTSERFVARLDSDNIDELGRWTLQLTLQLQAGPKKSNPFPMEIGRAV